MPLAESVRRMVPTLPTAPRFWSSVRRGLRSLGRDRSYGALFAALTGTMFLFHLLLSVSVGIKTGEQFLRSTADVRLPILSTATNQSIQDFFSALHAIPSVKEATLVTREQAYEQSRQRDPSLIAFLEKYKLQNPFTDTIAVELASTDNQQDLVRFVQQPQWAGVVDPAFLSAAPSDQAHTQDLLAAAEVIRFLSIALLVFAAIAVTFVLLLFFDVRSVLREDEVVVGRLLGAASSTLITPFAAEATVILFISSILSAVLLTLCFIFLPMLLPMLSMGGSFFPLFQATRDALLASLPMLVVLHVLGIPFIATMGVMMGVRLPKLTV